MNLTIMAGFLKGSSIKHWGNHVDWTYFDEWLAYEPEAVSISLDDVTRIL